MKFRSIISFRKQQDHHIQALWIYKWNVMEYAYNRCVTKKNLSTLTMSFDYKCCTGLKEDTNQCMLSREQVSVDPTNTRAYDDDLREGG